MKTKTNLRIHKDYVRHAGSCSFCKRPHEVVYVVSGNTNQVRFCNSCLTFLCFKKKGM